MDIFDGIATKLDVREFGPSDVSAETRQEILEAARLTGTGLNTQHWRFILVEGRDALNRLAEASTSGAWVAGANFAVIVLTNPRYRFHLIDAGRVLQNMQLAAWNRGVASGLFTGVREDSMRRDFAIPEEMHIALVIGFGYPAAKTPAGDGGKRKRKGKDRVPLADLVFYGRYGNSAAPPAQAG